MVKYSILKKHYIKRIKELINDTNILNDINEVFY